MSDNRPIPPESWAERRERIRHKWARPIHRFEWVCEWISYRLSCSGFLDVVTQFARLAVLIAVVMWFLEADGRRNGKIFQAWQVINTAQGKGGSGGRAEALADLIAEEVPLMGINLSGDDNVGAYLPGIDLAGQDLRRSVLSGAILTDAKLSGANLEDVDLSSANLEGADLREAKLRRADLSGAILDSANLSGVDLSHANLQGAQLGGVDFRKAKLWDVDLSGSFVGSGDFSGVSLWRANLSGAIITDVDLSGVNLSDADLFGAYIIEVDLSRANLSRANLYMVNLCMANLSQADLSGAILASRTSDADDTLEKQAELWASMTTGIVGWDPQRWKVAAGQNWKREDVWILVEVPEEDGEQGAEE